MPLGQIPPTNDQLRSPVGRALCFNDLMRHRGFQSLTCCVTVALALASCGGGGGGAPVPVAPTDTVVGEATIGPAGGSLTIDSGAHAGLSLIVPAGAISVATNFRALLDIDNSDLPSLFPVYRFEPSSIDLSAIPVTVTVPAGDVLFDNGTPGLSLFVRADEMTAWSAMSNSTVDGAQRTVTASVTRLGDFVASNGILHRLFTQELRIYDPAVPVASEFLFGSEVAIDNGSVMRIVGAGSLASFWNSSASDNVLILHGVIGSPLDFLGSEDLVANLALSKSNVVLLSFPSARGIAYVANRLYDFVTQNQRPGFGCSIVGHSIGGVIGRYLIEESHRDPARPGFRAGDLPFENLVDQLVMLGPPNAGAQTSTLPFAAFETALPESERDLLQVAMDLSEQPGSLPLVMNNNFVANATHYHVIYGDIGTGSDGVVSTMSALSVPLVEPETATLFLAPHDDLHQRATSLGIALWIGTLMQTQ